MTATHPEVYKLDKILPPGHGRNNCCQFRPMVTLMIYSSTTQISQAVMSFSQKRLI